MKRIFSGKRKTNEPSPEYKYIVARCLTDKGYEAVGWK